MGRASKRRKRQIFDPNAAFRSIIGGETIRQAEAAEETTEKPEKTTITEIEETEKRETAAAVPPDQPIPSAQAAQPVAIQEVPACAQLDSAAAPTHPARRGRPKVEREIKKRVSLAVLPSLYQDFQRIAYMERKSVSQLIAICMEQYLMDNLEKLDEYEQLTKRTNEKQ